MKSTSIFLISESNFEGELSYLIPAIKTLLQILKEEEIQQEQQRFY